MEFEKKSSKTRLYLRQYYFNGVPDFIISRFEVFEIKGLTSEVRAEARLLLRICGKIALIMLCKEEKDEVSLLFVNNCFYDKYNAEVDFIDKH